MGRIRVIPVLDVKDGRVVHAVAGRRHEYQPIRSSLTPSADPLEVAAAFRAQFGIQELYVADLDALAGRSITLVLFTELVQRGFHLWLDAGIREVRTAEQLREAGVQRIVLALESLPGPLMLEEIAALQGIDRLAFSIDLMAGRPMADLRKWGADDAVGVAGEVVHLGVNQLIVLDLAHVGGDGPGAKVLSLCSRLKEVHPEVEIITGGGVRSVADLRLLEACGVSAALVASALHDRRIRPEELGA